jgi:(1->4)-alpha-D-glucan 1-alpha-D-glucosylmutase
VPHRLRRALLLEERGHDELVARFQQTTPAVVAKGVEDTALYRHLRLLALNEVGGDPGRFGVSVADFHRANEQRAERHPRNLLISSTHDTKRSADVRARLVLLSAWADRWVSLVREVEARTADLVVAGAPDGAEQQLVLQTLLGAWPISPERLTGYLRKALREAKRTTSWIDPDEEREAAVLGWAVALLDHQPFLEVFLPFVEDVAEVALRVSLAQVLLKLTCPGVPDVYQGDELVDLSLVDPDNRRPVDWDLRRGLLDELTSGAPPTATTAKLWLIRTVLAHRAARPGAFGGSYRPLEAGPEVCAFTRGDDDLLVVVPVRPGRADVRAEVVVPSGPWVDVLHGGDGPGPDRGPTPVAELVGPWGVGLFARP